MSDAGPRLPDYLEYSREPTTEERATLALLNAALERRDVELIGKAYAVRLRRDLAAIRIDDPTSEVDDSPVEYWLEAMLRDGEHPSTGLRLEAELWFDLVVAAADATQDESEAWCVGDIPADHLVGHHQQATDWLHAARSTHPGVERMFRALQDDYESMGYSDAGWWSDRH